MSAPPAISAAPPGPVTLGGKAFADASELWNYVKALRDSLDRDATVTGTMLKVLLDLLDQAPAVTKKGCRDCIHHLLRAPDVHGDAVFFHQSH